MTANSYQKSVEVFEALVRAPGNARYPTPAALFNAVGLPATTGYRNVALLEGEAIFNRDGGGVYGAGAASIRTGLSAYGFGDMASRIQPVLLQLRQNSDHTSFVAIQEGMSLQMCAYLAGRLTRQLPVRSCYTLESMPNPRSGVPREIGLLAQQVSFARRTRSMLASIETREGRNFIMGVLISTARDENKHLETLLTRATQQMLGGKHDM